MADSLIPKRSRRNPWEVANLDIHDINEVFRQIQLAVDGLQVTEHQHTGTEKASSIPVASGLEGQIATEPLQIVESSITPPILNNRKDNYNPEGLATATIIRVKASTPVNITGLRHQPIGNIKKFFNYGTIDITLKDNNQNSGALNRFDLNADVVIGPDETVTLQYQSFENRSRWKVIGNSGGHAAATGLAHDDLLELTDDDHPQYVLVANLEADRATIITNWDDLTDGGSTALHTHGDSGIPPVTSVGTTEFVEGSDVEQQWESIQSNEDTLRVDSHGEGTYVRLRALQPITMGEDPFVSFCQLLTDDNGNVIYG